MVLGKMCTLVSCYLKFGLWSGSGWELVELQDLRLFLEPSESKPAFEQELQEVDHEHTEN